MICGGWSLLQLRVHWLEGGPSSSWYIWLPWTGGDGFSDDWGSSGSGGHHSLLLRVHSGTIYMAN